MMLLTVEQNVDQQSENVDGDEEDGGRQQSPGL